MTFAWVSGHWLVAQFQCLSTGSSSQFRCQHLTVSATGLNAHVKAKVRAAGSDELAETTWEETQKELAEGWMELDSSNVEGASWAMRFGLKQREKVRVTDDFSIAGVNQRAGMSERLKIFGIDDIAALLAHSSDTCEGPWKNH